MTKITKKSTMIEGPLRKMRTELNDPINYYYNKIATKEQE